MSRLSAFVLLLVLALLTACGIVSGLDEVLPDKRKEYRKSESLPDLEVPPDLTSGAINDAMAVPKIDESGTATFSTYRKRKAAATKPQEASALEQAPLGVMADERAVIIEHDPSDVWPKLRDFWNKLGFDLDLDDEELGVLETHWREDRGELVRDKFKVFAEPGQESHTTVLYISHVGERRIPGGGQPVWVERPPDQQRLEAMVAQLKGAFTDNRATALGRTLSTRIAELNNRPPDNGPAVGDAQPALELTAISPEPPASTDPSTAQRVQLFNAGGGKRYLTVAQDFANAWRNTGHALDQAGMHVEDDDRSRGVYIIHYVSEKAGADGGEQKKEGVLSKLAFWRDDDEENLYQISVTGVGEKTEIVVLNRDGRWDDSAAAGRILGVLQNALSKTDAR